LYSPLSIENHYVPNNPTHFSSASNEKKMGKPGEGKEKPSREFVPLRPSTHHAFETFSGHLLSGL